MLLLTKTIESIKQSLPRRGAAFAEAGSRHAALAPFADAPALAAALDGATLSQGERAAIAAALVAEHQAHRSKLAAELLTVAFTPALQTVRQSLRHPLDEDRDQIVLLAFLEAIASPAMIAAGAYAAPAIVLDTRRRVARAMQAERRTPKQDVDIDDEDFEHRTLDEAETPASWHTEPNGDSLAEMNRVLGHVRSERLRDVLMATVAGDESLRQYVARCLPGVGNAEREAEYQRLRRQRFNAIAKLRVLCRAEPPRRAA